MFYVGPNAADAVPERGQLLLLIGAVSQKQIFVTSQCATPTPGTIVEISNLELHNLKTEIEVARTVLLFLA